VSAGLWELFGERGRGVLVTLRRDGRPQLSNVDYLAEPGLIRCSTTGDRAKVRNQAAVTCPAGPGAVPPAPD